MVCDAPWTTGRVDLEQLPGFIRHGEANLEIIVVEIRLADGFIEEISFEELAVLDEKGGQRHRTGRNDADVAFDKRSQDSVAVAVLHHGIGPGIANGPPVLQSFAMHGGRQV